MNVLHPKWCIYSNYTLKAPHPTWFKISILISLICGFEYCLVFSPKTSSLLKQVLNYKYKSDSFMTK